MDMIGVGSLAIVILTGFFTGGVLILQAYPTLQYYGAKSQAGRGVATSLIRELGPVLCALMVAGRVGSAISAELGSMVVSQQIDAMRALGTSPIRKLVTPRVAALVITLPLLTVASDIFGLIGGGIVAANIYGLDTSVYTNSVRNGVDINDILGGVVKPLFFAVIIGIVSCRKGFEYQGRNSRGRAVDNKRCGGFLDYHYHRGLLFVEDHPDVFAGDDVLAVNRD